MTMIKQTTVQKSFSCSGVGLHSGEPAGVTVRAAPANTGIVFKRLDVDASRSLIPARYDRVSATMLGTTLRNEHDVTIATVEHLLAALHAMGVDNALVEVDGPEVPVMDGSSSPFVHFINHAGLRTLRAPKRVVEILKPVRVEDDDKWVEFRPHVSFRIDYVIDFDNPVIGRQAYCMTVGRDIFETEVSRARTFGFADEVDYLRANGLARGGSLDNAIVIDGDRVLNNDGLRYDDEFVRHKALDAIGDLFLAGGSFRGHYRAFRSGHELNNRLLRAVFADPQAWRWTNVEAQAARARPALAPQLAPANAA